MTPLAKLRRLWLDAHLWIGLGLLVVFAPLGVTGSILVWHDPLDRALHAQRYATTGPAASRKIEDYAAAAQAAFAGRARLTQIRLPQTRGDPVVAMGRMAGAPGPGGRPRTLNAWIDPSTARVLDTAEVAKGFTMVTHRLHGSLLIPDIGRKVVGWLGWAMLASSATGLWLWWPRRGGFLNGLRWRRGASDLFNLHHQMGFWLCLPLAALSLTGVYISFPQTSHALVGAPPPPQRPAGANRFPPPLQTPELSLSKAVAIARAAKPGAVVEVNVPTQGREPAWRIGLQGGGGERPTTVQVVDATGAVKAAGEGGAAAPDPVSKLVRRIHDGSEMGLAWQVVIFLAGIAPTVLGLTGFVMWLRRRARRRAILRGPA